MSRYGESRSDSSEPSRWGGGEPFPGVHHLRGPLSCQSRGCPWARKEAVAAALEGAHESPNFKVATESIARVARSSEEEAGAGKERKGAGGELLGWRGGVTGRREAPGCGRWREETPEPQLGPIP